MHEPDETLVAQTEKRIHIACATDDNFAPYAATMLLSALQKHPGQIAVHYLCPPEFSEINKTKISGMVKEYSSNILFHPIPDADVASLPPMRGIYRTVWYRVFLPDLLPETNRVLYLDADTFVAGSLDEIWQTDLEGKPLAAVANIIDPQFQSEQQQRCELPADAIYFNSGVLLMDLDLMRREGTMEQVLSYTRAHGERFIWGDQDALNAVLATNYLQLHPKFNSQCSLFFWSASHALYSSDVVREAMLEPQILHFEGGAGDHVRPWHYMCDHPFRHEYRKILRQTPWHRIELKDRNLKNMLRKYLPLPVYKFLRALKNRVY